MCNTRELNITECRRERMFYNTCYTYALCFSFFMLFRSMPVARKGMKRRKRGFSHVQIHTAK